MLCPPRRECFPIEVFENARRTLIYVQNNLHKSRTLHELKKIIEDLNHYIDDRIKDVSTIECVDTFNLGCFIPQTLRDYSHELEVLKSLHGPLIVVNVEGIENEVHNTINKLGLMDKEYLINKLSNLLFESVLTHEIFHAFTDLSNDLSPRKLLEVYEASKFYYRVIEESLATYYGMQLLKHDIYATYLRAKLLNNSPLEYRAGILWEYFGHKLASSVLKTWIGATNTAMLVCDYFRTLLRTLHHHEPPPVIEELVRFAISELLVNSHDIFLWKLLALKLATYIPVADLVINQ